MTGRLVHWTCLALLTAMVLSILDLPPRPMASRAGAAAGHATMQARALAPSRARPFLALPATGASPRDAWTPAAAQQNGGAPALPAGPRAVLPAGHTSVAPATTQQTLTAADAAQQDDFGTSVALSADGSTALVGAVGKTVATNGDAGAAYVFVRNGTTWTQQQKLTAADVAQNDYFGISVALSGDGSTALVGADGKDSSSGAASVFVRSGSSWSQQQSLVDPAPTALEDDFGFSVALSGDGSTALVGAWGKNGTTGAAYVFVHSGAIWTQRQTLTALDGAHGDGLGWSVALSGDGATALAGAQGQNNLTGAAYLFGIWNQQKLTALGAAQNDRFGWSAALSGDGATALVGAYGKNSNTGAAYVFSGVTPTTAYQLQTGWNLFAAGPGEAYVAASSLLRALLQQSGGSLAALYGLSNNRWSPSLVDTHGTFIGTDFDLQANTGYLLYVDHTFTFTPGAGSVVSPASGGSPSSGAPTAAPLLQRPPPVP